jgi:hypothetical protein
VTLVGAPDESDEQAAARTEVNVHGLARQPCGIGNLAHRNAGALPCEELPGHVEDVRAGSNGAGI